MITKFIVLFIALKANQSITISRMYGVRPSASLRGVGGARRHPSVPLAATFAGRHNLRIGALVVNIGCSALAHASRVPALTPRAEQPPSLARQWRCAGRRPHRLQRLLHLAVGARCLDVDLLLRARRQASDALVRVERRQPVLLEPHEPARESIHSSDDRRAIRRSFRMHSAMIRRESGAHVSAIPSA